MKKKNTDTPSTLETLDFFTVFIYRYAWIYENAVKERRALTEVSKVGDIRNER